MIVFDTSALVGAAIGRGSVPDRAVRHAFVANRIAVSEAMMMEPLDVHARLRLARFLDPELRDKVLELRQINSVWVSIEEKESIRWLSSVMQPSAVLGDPSRCVYTGVRENDIYKSFCAAREAGTYFLVRTCVDWLASDGRRTVAREMARVPVAGQHCLEVAAEDGSASQAVVKLRYKRVHILPPIGKQKRYPALDLTVIHAREARKPPGRDRVEWKLVIDLAVTSPEDAVEKLQ